MRVRMPRGARGLAAVEFAFVLPILLILVFAVVELGRAIQVRQILINVSREAANLSSRGTTLEDALSAVQVSAAPLDLVADGFVILSEVFRDSNGRLTVRKQVTGGGQAGPSRVGSGVGGPATLPATQTEIPPRGQNLYVAEVYFRAEPITPLGTFILDAIGETYYDVAFF